MLNLDQALADWRCKMRQAGIRNAATLDELESHLRDEFEAQLRSGLSETEALEKALERLGPVKSVQHEYAKVGLRAINLWLLASVALYGVVGGGPALFKLGSFSDITSTQQRSALTAVLVSVMLILSGRLLARISPVIPDRRLRAVLYGAGALAVGIWLVFFYHNLMTRVEWDMSQLVVGLLWAWTPMAALCGLIFGVESTANDRKKSDV